MAPPEQRGSIFSQLLELLLGLLKPAQPSQPAEPPTPPEQLEPAQPAPPAQPPAPRPPAESGELATLAPRVLLIVYNPIVEAATGKKLLETIPFQNPDQLVAGYIRDLDECSGGLAKFQVVARVEDDTFAAKDTAYVFDGAAYVTAYLNRRPLDASMVDYDAVLAKYNVVQRIANNELDEVWLMGYPSAGFYESVMGGRGAFWCNGPELKNTPTCPRRFVVMGFNYERGVGELLESFGHRGESIMEHVYRARQGDENLWHRFIRHEQAAPGAANCGNVHFAPNSVQDYDWGNPTPVQACADDWHAYPNLANPPNFKTMTANDWGRGDIREHHRWWLEHFPKAAGVTDNVANNWWKYVADPNNVPAERVLGLVEPERKVITHPWSNPNFK